MIGVPAGITNASFSTAISISTGLVKKSRRKKTTRCKKQNQNRILMLTRTKLNSIESKISEALIKNEISHEDFMKIY